MHRRWPALPLLLLVACGKPTTAAETPASDAPPVAAEPTPMPNHPVEPAVPAEPAAPEDDGAFARLWLRRPVTLRDGTELTLTSIVSETIEASPDDPESYPAGSGVTVTVDVACDDGRTDAEFVRLSPGYTSREIVWDVERRFELGVVDDSAISLRVDKLELTDAAPAAITLLRDQPVSLAPGVMVRLLAHSHKRTAGGPSPLMVKLRFTTEDGVSEEQDVNLREKTGWRWRWRDFDLVMTDHVYGERMDVEVRRLRRVPLSIP
ncbi:MAG: hypothetical protein R3A79_18090 [Nannocystaceae bacterium]